MPALTAALFAQRIRTVNTTGLRPTVIDAPGDWLRVQATRQPPEGAGQAPRGIAPRLLLRWANTPLEAVPQLHTGERLEVDDHGLVELLEEPVGLRSAGRVVARQAHAMTIDDLYPLVVDVVEQGGGLVRGGVRCAVWQPEDSDQLRGTFTDYDAEAPVEHDDVLTTNRALRLPDATTLKLGSHIVDSRPPRVRMRVRGDA